MQLHSVSTALALRRCAMSGRARGSIKGTGTAAGEGIEIANGTMSEIQSRDREGSEQTKEPRSKSIGDQN
ncbi:hypothetical protein EVAR_90775_1 [Eumeta japonica]|uniref:Uncharacterized protein n=1 Tax=Eumeta variegata TaxID=151549 RepID=A0A4C1YJR5_EUMVA|nr:hypothetical protein EVAR_90775_1 [Eumeta japonica]